jgi:putative (di)nucleoside polyphosphate hydrolase
LAYVHPEWLYYDFPSTLKLSGKWANYCGQRQRWFAFYWDHPASDCKLDIHDREFRVVQFMAIDKTLDSIVRFKREVYQQVVKIFTPVIRDYIGKLP